MKNVKPHKRKMKKNFFYPLKLVNVPVAKACVMNVCASYLRLFVDI